MAQPSGFTVSGSSQLVSRLRLYLYGFTQSPCAWFGKFSTMFQVYGMSRCETDYSIFWNSSATTCLYFLVYVNDIIIKG